MSTGTLRISSVTVEDSGSVECVASDDTTGIVVPEDSETTALVVLGETHGISVLPVLYVAHVAVEYKH